MRYFFIFTILFSSCSIETSGQKYQTFFHGEEEFSNQIQIPNEILELLSKDEIFKRCFDSKTSLQDFSKWLEATEVNLNDDGLGDILVKGINDITERKSNCINGNAISFWVFARNNTGYSLVSNLYTIKVEITKNKTQDFYNIKTFRNTGSRTYISIYKFDNQQYVLKSKEEKPLEN